MIFFLFPAAAVDPITNFHLLDQGSVVYLLLFSLQDASSSEKNTPLSSPLSNKETTGYNMKSCLATSINNIMISAHIVPIIKDYYYSFNNTNTMYGSSENHATVYELYIAAEIKPTTTSSYNNIGQSQSQS